MSLVSSGTSTGRAEVEDRRRSSDWVATIFGIGARAAECSVSVMRNVLKCCESRESETIQHTLFKFYAQFTLGSPHSFIYLGPGGAIKSAINHLNIGPGLREGESLRLPGPASI